MKVWQPSSMATEAPLGAAEKVLQVVGQAMIFVGGPTLGSTS